MKPRPVYFAYADLGAGSRNLALSCDLTKTIDAKIIYCVGAWNVAEVLEQHGSGRFVLFTNFSLKPGTATLELFRHLENLIAQRQGVSAGAPGALPSSPLDANPCYQGVRRLLFRFLQLYPDLHIHVVTRASLQAVADDDILSLSRDGRITVKRVSDFADYGEFTEHVLQRLQASYGRDDLRRFSRATGKVQWGSVAMAKQGEPVMNERRTWRFQYRLPEPLPAGAQMLTHDEAERELKRQLESVDGSRQLTVLWELARLYNYTGRQDQALECLRRVLAGESDLEAKAGCILALGQTMEQAGDFPAAIRFYREALAMEPARTEIWYFIHNNLGYSYNQIRAHAEAEKLCRSAISINPNRHNAYKNLGLALAGLGNWREAARCFVTATQKCANDPRAADHLRRLLEEHPELRKEFTGDLAHCQRSVRFVAEAARRAQAGIAVRVLIGGEDPALLEAVTATLQAVVQVGSVEIVPKDHWPDFVREACLGTAELVVFAPDRLRGAGDETAPGLIGHKAVKQIATQSPAAVVVLLSREEAAKWRPAYMDAGADTVLEIPPHPNALAEALKRGMQAHSGQH